MRSDLVEIFARIAVCKTDLSELRDHCISFMKETIAIRDVKSNLGNGFDRTVKIGSPVPTNISVKVGTISNELRACLDALACTLALRNGRSTNGVYFPISKDKTVFESDGYKKIKKISEEDRDKIISVNPYTEGNMTLVKLHTLDVKRKHIRLAACGVSGPSRHLGGAIMADATSTIILTDCAVNGQFMAGRVSFNPVSEILSEVGKSYSVAENLPSGTQLRLDFSLIFETPDVVKSDNIIEFLEKSLLEVERVVNMFR